MIPQETPAATAAKIVMVIVIIASPVTVTAVVVLVVVTVSIRAAPDIVIVVVVVKIAAHQAVKVAGPTVAPVAVVHHVVHAVTELIESTVLVAEAGLELAAPVAPTAALAGAAHDLGRRPVVVVAVALDVTATGILKVPQEASPDTVADPASAIAVNVVKIVRVPHHAAPTAVAASHNAVPHALPGTGRISHPPLEVLDLIHPRPKVVPGTAPGAVNVVSIFTVDRVLHGAAVFGDVYPVAIVFSLGELSGSVLEVSPAVVKILSSAIGASVVPAAEVPIEVLGAAAIPPAALVGSPRVFAPGHRDARVACRWALRRKGRPRQKCLICGQRRGRHDCREEDGR